jgi:hypothetical protein
MTPKKQTMKRTVPKTKNKPSGTASKNQKAAKRRPKAKPDVTPPKPRKPGRPSLYSEKRADMICKLLASGYPLTRICALEGMPCVNTVMGWLWDDSPHRDEFLSKYARAREQQAEIMADQIISIADDDSEDAIFVEGKDGTGLTAFPKANREFIQRSHLRVEARKWVAAKLLPKKYGDKLELSGNKEAPFIVEVVKFAEDSPSK